MLCGEEQFDNWLEQAQLMVEESECADKEKRRRVMESLKGPALEIVKSARVTDPEISAAKCLEALEILLVLQSLAKTYILRFA